MRHLSSLAAIIVAAVVVTAAGVAIVGLAQPGSSASPSPSTARSAVQACNPPSSDPKAGGPLTWRVAVRADSPQQVDLLYVSGWARLLCTASRTSDGSFGAVTTSMGGDPGEASTSDALSYVTGSEPAQGASLPTFLIVGRMPRGTARIVVTTSEGERRDATLGDGWYLANVAVTAGARPTDIVAYDSSGAVIGRLSDPNGVQPGASALPG